MSRNPTIDVAPVAQWFDIFCSMGVDKRKLLAALECQESELRQKDHRIPALHHNAMLNLGASELQIPGVILQIGIQTTPEHMGVVGHLMKNSQTLLGAGHQIMRYASVLSETGRWFIDDCDTSILIRYQVDNSPPYLQEIEQASLSACIGTLRTLAPQPLLPMGVGFTHTDPGYAEEYKNVFGISVEFEQKECSIRITREDSMQTIPHHQSYLLDLLQEHANNLLDTLNSADPTTTQVRQIIAKSLPEGKADIEHVSEHLHMSRWTLARHLKTEGVTFNDIVKEIRSKLAAQYLSDQKLSVSEVGFLLGYSEPSAFQRAFRSWYSCTPSEYRIQH